MLLKNSIIFLKILGRGECEKMGGGDLGWPLEAQTHVEVISEC